MSGTFLSDPIKKTRGGDQDMSMRVFVEITRVLGTVVLIFAVLRFCICCLGMPCLLTTITSLTICSMGYDHSSWLPL